MTDGSAIESMLVGRLGAQYVAKVCDRFEGCSSVEGRCLTGAHGPGVLPPCKAAHPSTLFAPVFVGTLLTNNSAWVAGRRGGLGKEIA